MNQSSRPRHSIEEPTANTVPIRGLAMILLAVAVLLIGWAAFSFLGNDKAADNTANNAADSTLVTDNDTAAGTGDVNGAGYSAGESNTASQAEEGTTSSEEAADDRPTAVSARTSPEATSTGKPATYVRAEIPVTVLNNSPIQGLAANTAQKLEDKKWGETSTGNLADTAGVFSSSVVLYPEKDPAAKAAAEDLAKELGIKARPRSEAIDKSLANAEMFGEGQVNKVVVITTNDMPQ